MVPGTNPITEQELLRDLNAFNRGMTGTETKRGNFSLKVEKSGVNLIAKVTAKFYLDLDEAKKVASGY